MAQYIAQRQGRQQKAQVSSILNKALVEALTPLLEEARALLLRLGRVPWVTW